MVYHTGISIVDRFVRSHLYMVNFDLGSQSIRIRAALSGCEDDISSIEPRHIGADPSACCRVRRTAHQQA